MSNNRSLRGTYAFTLVEVVVVLGVILLLAAIAVPLVSSYLEDGRRSRASAETKLYAASLLNMYKDTGIYPVRDSKGNTALRVLCTGSARPKSNPFLNKTNWSTWLTNAAYGDTMDNHLVANKPGGSTKGAYPTTGNAQWRGPYLPGGTQVDPWGRPYVCMVYSFHSADKKNYKRVIMLSAGPDGRVDTSPNCTDTTDIAGDDIGIILHQRR